MLISRLVNFGAEGETMKTDVLAPELTTESALVATTERAGQALSV
jgi:hypothetical protein